MRSSGGLIETDSQDYCEKETDENRGIYPSVFAYAVLSQNITVYDGGLSPSPTLISDTLVLGFDVVKEKEAEP